MSRKPLFDCITIGGATRDLFFTTDQCVVLQTPEDLTEQQRIAFELGAKIISRDIRVSVGGGGTNVAVTAARLGLRVASFVFVGKDHDGDAVRTALRRARVDTRFIHTHPTLPTGFSLVVVEQQSKDHTAFLARGANDALHITPREIAQLRTRWLHVSSLSGSQWRSVSRQILSAKRKQGCRIAWNPGETQLATGRQGMQPLLSQTDVLIINKDEAIELILTDVTHRPKHRQAQLFNDPGFLTETLSAWGPALVVLTDGKRGVNVCSGGSCSRYSVPPHGVADTTGAGDCFGGSFISGLVRFDGAIPRAVELAITNASALVQKVGSQHGLLTWTQAQRRMRR